MSATRDEVLRAMAEAANHAEFIMCDAATCGGMCEAPEVHFAPAIQRALAAAEQSGWVLRPVEPTEEMVRAAYEVGRRWLTDRGKPRKAWGELSSDERWFMRQCAKATLACEPTAAKP